MLKFKEMLVMTLSKIKGLHENERRLTETQE